MPFLELHRYEILMQLEAIGFECLQIMTSEEKKACRRNPYRHGKSAKHFFILGSDPKLSIFYLRCLLDSTTSAKPKPVMHFAQDNVYKLQLDPDWAPKERPLKALMYGGLNDALEWGAPSAR